MRSSGVNVDDDAHRVWRAPVPSANFNCRAADIDDEDLHGLLEVCVECSVTTGRSSTRRRSMLVAEK